MGMSCFASGFNILCKVITADCCHFASGSIIQTVQFDVQFQNLFIVFFENGLKEMISSVATFCKAHHKTFLTDTESALHHLLLWLSMELSANIQEGLHILTFR